MGLGTSYRVIRYNSLCIIPTFLNPLRFAGFVFGLPQSGGVHSWVACAAARCWLKELDRQAALSELPAISATGQFGSLSGEIHLQLAATGLYSRALSTAHLPESSPGVLFDE
ncbi:hypothetical protein ETAA8_67770 [Anatilimnocola aggregata]|uniref:Uncharacterized protein n=1 Tax=Anatilimnocola aggregata TaxID=2528021 RepID=A0A517YN16_9BACT|nr:hypothetical protein ETAA8_67770 [Anatilimnocola aggregata]